jgi:NarL family two-component system response regulator YdfI
VIRVAIAAASPVMRAGLEALIASSPGLELTGAAADLQGIEQLRVDVALVALDAGALPPFDGEMPPLVLLATESRSPFTAERFHSGVRAVLSREASAAGILAALEAAAGGMAVIDPRELEALLASAPGRQEAAEHTPNGVLTAREIEVLRMMAEGAANKTIAWKLGISEHTVKFHVASILAKLNAGTRTEAVTTGIRKGLVLL